MGDCCGPPRAPNACEGKERGVQLHTSHSLRQHPKENRLLTPSSLSLALLMMITSAVCWGSWANTYKGVKNYRFELFYWDYAVGIFLVSLVLAFTMGSTGNDAHSFLNNVRAADTSNIKNAMIGGALFNLANLLLVAAIDMAGLAASFPRSFW